MACLHFAFWFRLCGLKVLLRVKGSKGSRAEGFKIKGSTVLIGQGHKVQEGSKAEVSLVQGLKLKGPRFPVVKCSDAHGFKSPRVQEFKGLKMQGAKGSKDPAAQGFKNPRVT